MKTKYCVIGSEGQIAAVDFKCNLTLARCYCRPAKFSNGKPALVAANITFERKRDAELFRQRCETALAYKSGRLGRWLAPTFFVKSLPS